MAKAKSFPHQVFVYRVNEGTSDEYLAVSTEPNEVAEASDLERTPVGVYDLRETGIVKALGALYDRTTR